MVPNAVVQQEVETVSSPLNELREVKTVFLLLSHDELYFCTSCVTGCLAARICTQNAVVAMGFETRARFDLTFGRFPTLDALELPFDKAWDYVRQEAETAHPGSSAYLYLYQSTTPETEVLHMVSDGSGSGESDRC